MFWSRKLDPFIEEAGSGDLGELAAIHAEGFARGWARGEFQSLLASKGVFCLVVRENASKDKTPLGVAIIRVAADEAEILTIATAQKHRGRGVAKLLLQAVIRRLQADRVAALFLEVSDQNEAALGLYKKHGFIQVGDRKDYYKLDDQTSTEHADTNSHGQESALVMRLDLI